MRFPLAHVFRGVLCGVSLLSLIGCGENRLILAIRQGDVPTAEQLIAQGANLNAKGAGGETALHAAIKADQKELYSMLLQRGADPNVCTSVGSSVVHLAAMEGDVYWLREALKNGGNPNQLNIGNGASPESTPIFYALKARHTPNVEELIAAGAALNHVNRHGRSPLTTALEMDKYDAVINLIKAGADLNLLRNHERGRFRDEFEKQLNDETQRRQYQELKALLIENGYLKPP